MAAPPSPDRALPRSALAPLAVPDGTVAGADIVRELAPELALTVWQALRSVLLWAAQEPSMRGELWTRETMEGWEEELLEAAMDNDLRYPLAVIAGELARGARAEPEKLSRGCVCVTEWALSNHAVCTALAFAEAAAHAWPEHGRYAWLVGRLLRKHGRLRDAESWIRRAIQIAISTGDWETQTLGLNSLGNVFYERGNYAEARRVLSDALRTAQRHGLRDREGEIFHDLFAVSTWAGDLDQAEKYAAEAYNVYEPGHHRFAGLAYDLAVLWLKRGDSPRALYLLKQLPPHVESPEDRVRLLGALARAAAACGDESLFDTAWAEAWVLATMPTVEIRTAPDLLELGLGAANLNRWELAQRALKRAHELATKTGEADVQFKAETALKGLRSRRVGELDRDSSDVVAARARDQLVTGFVTSLHQSRSVAAAV